MVKICLECRRHRLDPWVGEIPWSRKWQAIPVFLLGKILWQRSLVGYDSKDCKELYMTKRHFLSQILKTKTTTQHHLGKIRSS